MVGLQGSGKTTTVGKLARFLEKQHKRPLLVAADVYRPAAIDQLKILGEKLDMPVFADPGAKPPDICERAMQYAAEQRARRHPLRHRRPARDRRAADAGAGGDQRTRAPGATSCSSSTR